MTQKHAQEAPTVQANPDPETGGQAPQDPTGNPLTIARAAAAVATHLRTAHEQKKHGGYDVYQDDKLRISLDTYVPNLWITVISPDGELRPVFSASHFSWHRPSIFRPGRWTQYLLDLAQAAATKREELNQQRQAREEENRLTHFGPIDDQEIFPAPTPPP